MRFLEFLFRPLDDNPLYAREVARPGTFRTILRILVGLALAILYAGVLLALAIASGWVDESWAPLLQLMYLPAAMLLGYVPPAIAALAIAGERNAETLEPLILTPYPREKILVGLLLARLRPLLLLLQFSLPALLAGGFAGGLWLFNNPGATWGAWQWSTIPLGILAGGMCWGFYVCTFWFSVCCGAWASLYFPQAGAAIAIAYVLNIFVPQILGCIGGIIAVPVLMMQNVVVYWLGGFAAFAATLGFYVGVPWFMWKRILRRIEGADLG